MLFNGKNGISSIKDLFTNKNEKILQEETSQRFLQSLEPQWNSSNKESIEKLAGSIKGLNGELVESAIKAKEAGVSFSDLGTKFAAQTSLAGKFKAGLSSLGKIGVKALSTLGDAAVSAGISAIISLAIEGVYKLINSYKDLAARAKEISQEYQTNKKTLSDYTGEIRNLRDKLADQESTTDEVREATKRLYEIQSDLVATYGEQASGIDIVNGKLQTQLKIIEDIDKQNANKAAQDIDSKRSSLAGGINVLAKSFTSLSPLGFAVNKANNVNTIFEGLKNEKSIGDIAKEVFSGKILNVDVGEGLVGSNSEQIIDRVEKFSASIKNIDDEKIKSVAEGLKGISFDEDTMNIAGSVDDVSNSISILQTRLQEYNKNGIYDDVLKQLQDIGNSANEIYQTSFDSYITLLTSQIYNDDKLLEYYKKIQGLNDDIQKARESGESEDIKKANEEYSKFIKELEASNLPDKFKNFFTNLFPDLQNLVSEWKLEVEIIPKMSDSTKEYFKNHTEEEINAGYSAYMSGAKTSPENAKIYEEMNAGATAGGFSSVKNYIGAVKSQSGFTDNLLHMKELAGSNWKDEWADYFTDEELEIAASIEPRYTEESQKKYKEAVERIPEKFRKLGEDTLDLKTKILEPDDYEYYEIKQLIEDKIGEIPVKIDLKTSDEGIEKLDALADRLDDIDTVFATVKDDGGIADASDVQSVNDSFGGVQTTTTDENGNEVSAYTELAGALLNYNDALVEHAGDSDLAKQRTNELITASMNLDDTFVDLTEANAEYKEEMLKLKGVTNAEEVVTSRLNKTYAATRDKLSALTKAISSGVKNGNKFYDILKNNNKESQEFKDTCEDLVKPVSELVGLYNQDTGEFVEAANIDSKFVEDNAQDILDVYSGVEGALDKLYADVAKFNAEQVLIKAGVDDSQFDATMNDINYLVDMANQENITVEALMNDTNFTATLNSVLSRGSTAVNALNEAFGSIGFKAEYKKTGTTKIQIPDGRQFTAINSAADYKKYAEYDNFELVTTATGKGTTGATANYGGGNTTNTNSGGSGDSGSSNDNDASEHTAETFDWIEVAITRVEEEIDRLDDKVNNVYSKWGDRNEALKDEIDKVTEEIEDQNQAYSEYMSYANGVKVNNGVTKVNDDDYGDDDTKQKEYDQAQLDRAIELWNSGEYQEKVRKGLLTDTDIENIQNDYLKDAINSYKSYYESAIQAKDKVAELEEEVSKLNKQKFDNIKDEFDDLITNITKKTDLIEERISRAEKKGYFVSTNYYQQELELEEQNRQTLLEKRKKLTKQLNESVKNGSIKEGSEAFNEMKQSIMDVNAELEKSATNTVELANAMRQIQWDKWEFWQDQVSRATTEAQNLIDLVSTRTEAYDDKGYFNNNSYTQAALHGAKINVLEDQRAQHLAHIKQLQADLSKEENKGNKDLLEQLQKEIDGYNEKTKAISDEEQAIKSLVQEGINAYISSLNELISKYKDSLSAAKDLYTYQNNIADQTKKIASLEKQLTAYEGDDSEETRKRRQELQTQLEDAQRSLEETQWDRYISQTGDMLDKTSEKVEKYLNEKAKDIVEVMRSVKAAVDANKQAVEDELNDIKATYEPYLKYFNKFAKNNGELYELLGEDSTINKGVSSIEKILGKVYDTIKTYTNVNSEKKTGQAGKNDVNVKKSNETKGIQGVDNIVIDGQSPKIVQKTGDSNYQWVKDDKGYKYQNKNDGSDYNTNYFLTLDKKKYYLDKNGYMVKGWKKIENRWFYFKKDGSMAYSEWETIDGKKYYFNDKGIMVTGKQEIEGKKYTFGKNGVYKKKGWRKGTANVPKTDLYWTNENASELIYRTTDGAILTPLNAGDMVFNHDQMKALYEMSLEQANNGAASIGNSLSSVRKTSNTNHLSINVEQVIANDPMEFAERLRETIKNDTRTDKLIKQITIGEMTGGNTLTKNRY